MWMRTTFCGCWRCGIGVVKSNLIWELHFSSSKLRFRSQLLLYDFPEPEETGWMKPAVAPAVTRGCFNYLHSLKHNVVWLLDRFPYKATLTWLLSHSSVVSKLKANRIPKSQNTSYMGALGMVRMMMINCCRLLYYVHAKRIQPFNTTLHSHICRYIQMEMNIRWGNKMANRCRLGSRVSLSVDD